MRYFCIRIVYFDDYFGVIFAFNNNFNTEIIPI